MKKISFLLSLLSLLLLSCKKDSRSASQASQNQNGITTSTVIIGGDNGTFISVYNYYDYGSGMIYQDRSIQACFYDAPGANHNYISAGTVTVNNFTLSASQNTVVYSESDQVNMHSLSWQVSGSGTISPTSFSYVPVYPVYTGSSLLQDTISKSAGVTFTLSGMSNITQNINVTIGQNNSVITRTIASTGGVVTLSATDIASFSINNNFTLRFFMCNYSSIYLNSREYGINANRTYTKGCYLKP